MSCWKKIAVFLVLFTCVCICHADRLGVWQANSYPTRLAEGPEGKIYVTDYFASSVFIYDSALNLIGELREPERPLGIAVDRNGRIYVGDDDLNNIQVYDLEGNLLRTFGSGVIEKPTDFVIDDQDNVYVADPQKNSVLVFNASGIHLGSIGSFGNAPGQLKNPLSIALSNFINTNGHYSTEIYVGDQGNSRIQVFNKYGDFLRAFGGPTTGGGAFWESDWEGKYEVIQSIQVDAAGNLHVLDSMMHNIQEIHPIDGTMIGSYGSYGSDPGKLKLPLDIVVRDDGSVVVANAGNQRVEVIGSNAVSQVTLSGSTLDEHLPAGTVVGTFSLNPPVGGSNSYVFAIGHGDTHNDDYFSISGSNLLTAQELDFEDIASYSIRVSAVTTNSSNLSRADQFTISLNDINDAPTGVTLDDNYIPEGVSSGTLVGNFIAIDQDTTDSFTYWLTNGVGDTGNSSFTVSGSNLLSAAVFNYDTNSSFSIRAVARDSAGKTATSVLNVAVVNITQTGEWDIDGDEMADWWEWEFSTDGTKTNFMPNEDSDGDGLINLYEFIAFTDPDDYQDRFEVKQADNAGQNNDHTVLRWDSHPDRLYSIEWTTNFSLGFTNIVTNIIATPPRNTYTDTTHNADSFGYYKIKVQLAP